MTFVCVIGPGSDSVEGGTQSSYSKKPLVQSSQATLEQDSNAIQDGQVGRRQPASARGSRPSSVSSSPQPIAQEAPPTESDDAPFTIRDFFVQGNTLLLPDRVDTILAPFRGPGRHFSDIEAARAALEKAYRQAGYPTAIVGIPEQTVEYGIITLSVIEARVGAIEVNGARFFSTDNILGKLPSFRSGRLLYEPTVLKELDTANANPDLKIVPILKPGKEPDTLDLELKVKDRMPVHGRVELNNRGVPTTPRLRLNAALQYTNLFDSDHAITVQTSQTPQDWGAVEVYSVNYAAPLSDGHHLVGYAATARSRSSLGATPVGGGADIIGNSVIAGLRYLFPLRIGSGMDHQLSLGVDYKHLDRSEATFPGGINVTVTNPISYTPGSLGYTGVRPDQWGLTKLTASVRGYVAGMISGGGKEDFAGNPQDPDMPGVCRGCTGTFVAFKGEINRDHRLPHEFELSLRADGQWVNSPVPPTELYFAGGMESVRGYREFEAIGDDAVRASVELISPPIPALPAESIRRSLRLAAFYDLAYLWIKEAAPGQVDRSQLAGAGVGLRLALSDYVRFRYDSAWTLKPGPVTPTGSYYGHFSLEVVF